MKADMTDEEDELISLDALDQDQNIVNKALDFLDPRN